MKSAAALCLACLVSLAASCATKEPPPANEPTATPEPATSVEPAEPVVSAADAIKSAVDSAERPDEDRERDEARRPADVLSFFAIEPGMRVVDIAGASGYYTELLARVVGADGEVYAQNNEFLRGFADKPLAERLERIKLAQIKRIDSELDEPGLPADVDAVVMVLFFHDTVWLEVDREKFLAAVFAALKPGGVFGIVDHHAEAGSGLRDVKTIHRIDIESVKAEITAAGFVLDGESDVLRHREDDRTKNVFDKTIRGKTDRFILRFRKPGPAA